ncbi:hypothetical protein FRB90_006734, partial [Tulasnella sp. 427]
MQFWQIAGHAKRHKALFETSVQMKTDEADGMKFELGWAADEPRANDGTFVRSRCYPDTELLMGDTPTGKRKRALREYACRHCEFSSMDTTVSLTLFTVDGLRSHLKSKHSIWPLRNEDFCRVRKLTSSALEPKESDMIKEHNGGLRSNTTTNQDSTTPSFQADQPTLNISNRLWAQMQPTTTQFNALQLETPFSRKAFPIHRKQYSSSDTDLSSSTSTGPFYTPIPSSPLSLPSLEPTSSFNSSDSEEDPLGPFLSKPRSPQPQSPLPTSPPSPTTSDVNLAQYPDLIAHLSGHIVNNPRIRRQGDWDLDVYRNLNGENFVWNGINLYPSFVTVNLLENTITLYPHEELTYLLPATLDRPDPRYSQEHLEQVRQNSFDQISETEQAIEEFNQRLEEERYQQDLHKWNNPQEPRWTPDSTQQDPQPIQIDSPKPPSPSWEIDLETKTSYLTNWNVNWGCTPEESAKWGSKTPELEEGEILENPKALTAEEKKETREWEINKGKALASIVLNVAPEIQYVIKEDQVAPAASTSATASASTSTTTPAPTLKYDTAKKVWERLKDLYDKPGSFASYTLQQKLYRFSFHEGESYREQLNEMLRLRGECVKT